MFVVALKCEDHFDVVDSRVFQDAGDGVGFFSGGGVLFEFCGYS